MMQRKKRSKITKSEWASRGGLRNPKLYRVQSKSGRWYYYEIIEWRP